MATSFDAILQADRLKRKNEQLANKLLGSGRRSSTSNNGVRKLGRGNLANRIGVSKRSASAAPRTYSNVRGPATSQTNRTTTSAPGRNPRPFRENPLARKAQKERISENLMKMDLDSTNSQTNVVNGQEEISIRGAAGPYIVVGKNFAPGTTAADIESALAPIGGPMEDCTIISQKPTVIAEMVFLEKAKAADVIATFDNKKADGRLLRLSLKSGKPATVSELPSHDPPRIDLTQSAISHEDPPRNEPSRNAPPHNAPSQPKAARADLTYKDNSYSAQREQSDRARRRAAPEFQDGSYGFEQKEDRMEVDNDDRRDSYYGRQRQYGRGRHVGQPREERRLYSDDLYPGPRGRGFR